MTLNLMATSRTAVFLSGDFRITSVGEGVWQDRLDVQKLIPVFRYRWSALVAFAGVAEASNVGRVDSWLSAQLDGIPAEAGLDELSRRLFAADRWLSELRGDRRIAFSVVGFAGRKPFAMVISNFLDIHGNAFGRVRPWLEKTEVRPKGPKVLAVGDSKAVTKGEIAELERMLSSNEQLKNVKLALARINAAAAKRTNTISEQCVTGRLFPTGEASLAPRGISGDEEYIPEFLQRMLADTGITGFECKVDENGRRSPPIWKQMNVIAKEFSRTRAVVGVFCEFENVAALIAGEIPKDKFVFTKIAGENEPMQYTFTVDWDDAAEPQRRPVRQRWPRARP